MKTATKTATKQHAPNSADLQRGHNDAERELQDASAAHARAAYPYAMNRNDPAARDAVLAAKVRMDLLTAEMQGLGAAAGEATRLEKSAALESAVSVLDNERLQALESVTAVETAFGRVVEVIKELQAAHAQLEADEAKAYGQEAACVYVPNGHVFHSKSQQTRALVDGLLWWAVGDRELYCNSAVKDDFADQPDTDIAAGHLQRQSESARFEINKAIDRKIQALKDEAAGIKKLAPVDTIGDLHETLRLARRGF